MSDYLSRFDNVCRAVGGCMLRSYDLHRDGAFSMSKDTNLVVVLITTDDVLADEADAEYRERAGQGRVGDWAYACGVKKIAHGDVIVRPMVACVSDNNYKLEVTPCNGNKASKGKAYRLPSGWTDDQLTELVLRTVQWWQAHADAAAYLGLNFVEY